MRSAFVAGAFVVLCGCDPFWGINVQVKSPTGQPVADAPVELRCKQGPNGTWRTNAKGEVAVGGVGSTTPPECTVKVSMDGYVEQQFTSDEACNGDRAHCTKPSREVVLQPAAAAPPPAQ